MNNLEFHTAIWVAIIMFVAYVAMTFTVYFYKKSYTKQKKIDLLSLQKIYETYCSINIHDRYIDLKELQIGIDDPANPKAEHMIKTVNILSLRHKKDIGYFLLINNTVIVDESILIFKESGDRMHCNIQRHVSDK